MQTIPLELEKAFRSEGGKTSLNTQLLKVQKNGDMDYELTLRKTWSSPCNQITSFTGPEGSGAGEVFTVKAKKVLISLTKSALESVLLFMMQLVDPDSLTKSRGLQMLWTLLRP